jgi:hypothetical protein
LAIQAKNPRLYVPLRYQVSNAFSLGSSDIQRLLQLMLAPYGLVIVGIDHYEQSCGRLGRSATVLTQLSRTHFSPDPAPFGTRS